LTRRLLLSQPSRSRDRRGGTLTAYSFAGGALDRVFVLGLAAVIAALYGASADTDAYFFGLVVPLTIGTILMEAAYTAALPRLADDGAAAPLGGLMRTVALAALVAFVGYVVLLLVAQPAQEGVWLSLSPLILVLAITGVYAAVLVRGGRYAAAALRLPAASALALLSVAVLSQISQSILIASISVTAAYIVVLVSLILIAHGQAAPAVPGGGDRPGDVVRSLVAAAAAVAVGGPLVILLERAFASTLEEGSITLLAYARGLALVPFLLSAAIANGVFLLAVDHARSADRRRLSQLAMSGIRMALASSLLAALFIALQRREIVGLALEHGELHADDGSTTAELVGLMAFSVVGLAAVVVGTRVLLALERRRLVTAIGAGSVVAYALVAPPLAMEGGAHGLAFAFVALATGSGVATLVYVAAALELRLRDALRHWVVVPLLYALPFTLGALVGRALAAEGSDPSGAPALVELLASLGLGLICLGGAVALVRPDEYETLRRLVRARAGSPG
jgi:putative peptidoglycan lipid II flippase